MTWKCDDCGNKMTKQDFENWAEHKENADASKFKEIDEEQVNDIILVDCPKCDNDLAEYRKNITESTDSDTTNRSKMLQAARS